MNATTALKQAKETEAFRREVPLAKRERIGYADWAHAVVVEQTQILNQALAGLAAWSTAAWTSKVNIFRDRLAAALRPVLTALACRTTLSVDAVEWEVERMAGEVAAALEAELRRDGTDALPLAPRMPRLPS
jgi:hypothetical protein